MQMNVYTKYIMFQGNWRMSTLDWCFKKAKESLKNTSELLHPIGRGMFGVVFAKYLIYTSAPRYFLLIYRVKMPLKFNYDVTSP